MLRLVILILLLPVLCYSQDSLNLTIVYHSESGNTRDYALEIQKGAKSISGVSVNTYSIDSVEMETLLSSNGIIFGCPVYNANPSPEMLSFIKSLPFEGDPFKDKLGAVFVTGGGVSSGEELAQMSLIQSLLIFRFIIVGGDDWLSAFGASKITGSEPPQLSSEEFKQYFNEKGFKLGKRMAEVMKKFDRDDD